MTIQGLGAANLTIDAAGQSRVFNVDDGISNTMISVSISGLTLTNGYTTGNGGAIYSTERLTVQDSIISGNTASGNGGGI